MAAKKKATKKKAAKKADGSKLVMMTIQCGDLEQATFMPIDFAERLKTFIAAHPFSLVRMFEIGAVAAMSAYSGDSEAARFIRRDLDPVDQASQRGRRKSRAPRATAKKRS